MEEKYQGPYFFGLDGEIPVPMFIGCSRERSKVSSVEILGEAPGPMFWRWWKKFQGPCKVGGSGRSKRYC